MLRMNRQGFTLIELMVVIVIIGVLASLAIPRFTEASAKAKMGEAPRIIASFESGFLATVAEKGFPLTNDDELMVKIDEDGSNWFDYKMDMVVGTLIATVKDGKKIGKFEGSIGTVYDDGNEKFDHCADKKDEVAKLIPSFAGANATISGECPAASAGDNSGGDNSSGGDPTP
jgi:prepilin-type N-terminal cleavage/methylation domain-containing protein